MRVQATINLDVHLRNPYPGRGIVVGKSSDGGSLIQAYWIMGRSENSRNRVFKYDQEKGWVWTAAADKAKVKDPSLILYDAMLEHIRLFAVSNGAQTEAIVHSYPIEPFMDVMGRWKYEPDSPNHTPRISAISDLGSKYDAEFCIIRRSPFDDSCERHFYHYEYIPPGFGYCITTYTGDGEPLPSFRGEPYLLPLGHTIDEVKDLLWNTLNADNRISLAVKFIDLSSGRSETVIVNQYTEVT